MISIYGHKWTSHLGNTADDGAGMLSDTAKTWRNYLAGVTQENLKTGFDNLVLRQHDWPPSLPEFRGMCLSRSTDKVPGIDQVIATLVTVAGKKGSIVDRYKHPLIFAIGQQIDMHGLRVARQQDAKRLVKAVYDDYINSGYPGFPEHAYESQMAVTHEKKTVDKELARNHLTSLKANL